MLGDLAPTLQARTEGGTATGDGSKKATVKESIVLTCAQPAWPQPHLP